MYYIARTSCIHIPIPCFKLLEPFLCHDFFSLHVYSLSIIEYQYIKILLVCLSVCDGCGRGRNGFAGRVQNHHVRFSFHVYRTKLEMAN